MRIRIHALLPILLLTLAWVGLTPELRGQEQVRIAQEALVDLAELDQVIAAGERFEQERRWGEALMHYEQAVREYPQRQELGRRLLTARMHYDIGRRYHDRSFVESVDRLKESQALDLYAEILLRIHSHYVEEPDWTQIVRRGGQAIEVALSEPTFLKHHRLVAKPNRLNTPRSVTVTGQLNDNTAARSLDEGMAAFMSEVQRMRPVTSRHDARQMVQYFAHVGQRQLGITPASVVLEFASAATGTLDNYSAYLTGDQLNDVMSQIDGNFVGLGIELKAEDNALLIVNVIPGGPADQAGLDTGERIVAVDGHSTTLVSTDTAADMLKGVEGSTVSLTIQSRQGQPRNLQLRRERVDVPSIEDAGILDKQYGIAYLRLSSFQKTTGKDFEAALWDLHRQGMRSLIVDVRGNPGGLLTASVDVADKFVSQGTIVRTIGRSSAENHDYRAHTVGTWRVPLIVLIDGDSASASEIFAGAIRDHRRGTLIGKRSYGKGSVQGIFPLDAANAGVRLTTAKFYSPSGRATADRGVHPDIVVQATAKPTGQQDAGQKDAGQKDAGDDRLGAVDAVLNASLQVARRQLTQR
jgi:carboxyl-terminal processing protease